MAGFVRLADDPNGKKNENNPIDSSGMFVWVYYLSNYFTVSGEYGCVGRHEAGEFWFDFSWPAVMFVCS